MGAARPVADPGADCDVAPCDPEADAAPGEDDGRGVSAMGVCLTGVGSGGALTDGVEMLGVEMLGVEMLGVEMVGVVILGVVTGGVVTEGTVTAGTLTVGTETVGTDTVGTETVGTLIVGTDAAVDATGTSSAPEAMSTAITYRRTTGRTIHRSPPHRSATEGLDIANPPAHRSSFIGPRARKSEVTARRAAPSPVTGLVQDSNRKVV